MKVTVRLFASLREAAGTERLEIEVPEGASVAAVLERVGEVCPPLVEPLARLRPAVARNRSIAGPQEEVSEGDELALLPPVSGG